MLLGTALRWSKAGSLLVLFAVGYVLLRRVLLVVAVEGASMVPTLHYGDRVLVWRCCPHRWLRRGRIVVVAHEADLSRSHWPIPQEPALYIKRVVGLPGDTVQWSPDTRPVKAGDGKGGNGTTPGATPVGAGNGETYRLEVPPRHLFVCGDNRPGSRDSRYWGPLPLRSLRGIVLTKLPGKRLVVRTRLLDGTYVTDVRRAARFPEDDCLFAERRRHP